ncbi:MULTISPECIES: NADP-dependent oxidoreductase [Amycolatopsis]|uniref:NADPH:quinone reductase n=2 Tax=Amycolatopsis TaxID=1813 RepID=A0A1I3WKR8_9PSEU|nr:NADP-dependent oxidoreductase [Amycolatopsis sacchari]SFK08052.1 NADPH:quinone reductase [Amycolatopsis sacchari]
MPEAVRFSRYGGPEVLELAEVPRPRAGRGQIVVAVVAAALNPGETGIREGVFAGIWPAHFPEGQGNDFAGRVAETGEGVEGFAVGDEVLGFAPRAAQAEFVVVGPDVLAPRPAALGWAEAASIAGAGATAWAGVRAVDPRPGETVVVSAAAGGVGVIAAQLAKLRGATVIGTASEGNFAFLHGLGISPVTYGPGLAERLRAAAPQGVDAYLDTFGGGNVDVAIELDVRPGRINTIADEPAIWAALAESAATGEFTIPIDRVYPVAQVRDAYRDPATRHVRGKRVPAFEPLSTVEGETR